MNYAELLASKQRAHRSVGFEPTFTTAAAYPFQRDLIRQATRRGRCAIFAGTGLGKTLMELSWARNVADYSGLPVLLLTPLAVSAQTIREAGKFGISLDGIRVLNYQRLHTVDPDEFGGVVLDESSILKSFDGKFRTALIDAFARTPYRLAATATPAPNDFMELGNHAQFLGVCSYAEMLATWFVHDGGDTSQWRLKGHAQDAFWKWMASWAALIRSPRDLGYVIDGYDLPTLHQIQHVIPADYEDAQRAGSLFPVEAQTLQDRRGASRATIDARADLAASLVNGHDRPVVCWVQLNDEADAVTRRIPGAIEVRGSDDPDDKERKLLAFSDGEFRVLVTKPSIAGFGMNWQHCSDTVFVGLNDSFEQVYQAIRRFWRFGQTREVRAHFVSSELEGAVVANLRRKEEQAEQMAEQMASHVAALTREDVTGSTIMTDTYNPQMKMELPKWMC